MSETLRLDKWLWYARFFKTRSLCSERVQMGGFRVNKTPVSKPSTTVRVGDVLTFALNNHVRVIKVVALAERRGPAPEAQALYEDLDPPTPRVARSPANPRFEDAGRPTKKDARALRDLKRSALE
ncbi:MAG: RNA-binding S4 domain-containing protein [Pseudomonadota bacterium]